MNSADESPREMEAWKTQDGMELQGGRTERRQYRHCKDRAWNKDFVCVAVVQWTIRLSRGG